RDDFRWTWRCNTASPAEGCSVERPGDGVTFPQLASLAPTVTTFTDPKVGPGAFFYRVRTFNAQGFSRPSNTATAEINVPAAPVNLQIVQLFAQHTEIGWDPSSSNQSGFQVERSSDGIHFTPIPTVDAFPTSFLDVRLAAPV